ncbi:SAM-dependent methyltransferase [Streptomyces jumonjinensis]|uniref:SAM-dependent methyltransferase n=1 Tax=Streptomyces jumonjinensis TaxID=1945 RepID=UPI00379935E8
MVPADLLDMETLLTRHGLAGAFDLDRPIAVTVHDVLPWNPDDTAVADAMAVLRPWLPVGSTLSIAHLAHHFNPRTVPQAVAAYERHGITIRPATWINSCAQEYRTRKLTAPRHIHQLVALGIELTEDRRCRRL